MSTLREQLESFRIVAGISISVWENMTVIELLTLDARMADAMEATQFRTPSEILRRMHSVVAETAGEGKSLLELAMQDGSVEGITPLRDVDYPEYDDEEELTNPCIRFYVGDSALGEDRAARLGKW